jgi:predicted ferric reductase
MSKRRTNEMRHVLWGAFWIAVYLGLVLAPLLVLLLGDVPGGMGFWWDSAIAFGFAGLMMMGIQFVLTARFKVATAPYGIDVIYFFHRYLAVVAFLIVLAHPVALIAVNPAFVHLLNPFSAPWTMTAGVLSLVLMAALIGTSLWRKPLGIHYDAWRVAHGALAVGAVALGLTHVEGVGHYIATPWKRGLWTVFTGSWIAVLLHVRLVRPWRMLRRPYRVASVTEERGSSWTVVVEPVGHRGFAFDPGQFSWLTLRGSPFAMREHPFSMSSSPSPTGRLEFTIKELGDFTRTIKHIGPGETAYVDGPYGAFTIGRHPAPGYVFIGGGIGVAPLMSMLRALDDARDRRPHLLITGNSRWERITFREATAELAARLDLRVVHVLEDPPEGWEGERGFVRTELLNRYLPENRTELEYFVCGPEPMIAAVERSLYDLGVPLARSHSELFDLV